MSPTPRQAAQLLAAPVVAPLRILRFAGRRSWGLLRRQAPPPGSRPGELAIPADAPPPEIRVLLYGPDTLVEHMVDDVDEIPAPPADGVLWVDVRGFGDEALLERLRQRFDVHPLALADAVHVPQRPKVEDFDGRHLIVTRMAQLTESREVDLEQLSLILGPGFVLTFQERPGDVLEPVRRRLRAAAGLIRRQGPDYLVYALLDAVVDGYFPVVEALSETLEELEDEVIGRPTRSTVARVHATRRVLLVVHRILWRQRDALNGMLRDERSPFSAPVRLYLRDAYDHCVQILDAIETARDLAVGLMDIYLSNVSNRLNEVMKTLTVMASIFIPLTFIAGVYGMNFRYMPELGWRLGYPVVWGVMIAIAVGLLIWFRRRGWLGDGTEPDE